MNLRIEHDGQAWVWYKKSCRWFIDVFENGGMPSPHEKYTTPQDPKFLHITVGGEKVELDICPMCATRGDHSCNECGARW